MNNQNSNLNSITILDIINILSFILQIQNNEELEQQSTNDDILEMLHNDVMELLEDNRKLFNITIEQNNEILDYLKGNHKDYEQTRN
jgi:ethanolamine utilization cobalamin adenosyltransferase